MTQPNQTMRPTPRSAEQILEDVHFHFDALKRRREAKQLGARLLQSLHISPEGIQCICLLADGECSSNREAMTQWVDRQLSDPAFSLEPHATAFDQLLRMLNRHLISLETANS